MGYIRPLDNQVVATCIIGRLRGVVQRYVVDSDAPFDPDEVAVVCTIDNLRKGAASQAVQNINLALGHDGLTGLSTGDEEDGAKARRTINQQEKSKIGALASERSKSFFSVRYVWASFCTLCTPLDEMCLQQYSDFQFHW